MSRASALGAGMLPTPAKTPRKRVAQSDAVKTTARVLFPGRPAKADDAMPPVRKAKKGKRAGLFSLDGMNEDGDDEAGKISIYTDSKERVPEPDIDDGEENPFVTKGKGKAKVNHANDADDGKVDRRRRGRASKELLEEVAEMEAKVKNDEGMIYVL